jgi:hypothetical protein
MFGNSKATREQLRTSTIEFLEELGYLGIVQLASMNQFPSPASARTLRRVSIFGHRSSGLGRLAAQQPLDFIGRDQCPAAELDDADFLATNKLPKRAWADPDAAAKVPDAIGERRCHFGGAVRSNRHWSTSV